MKHFALLTPGIVFGLTTKRSKVTATRNNNKANKGGGVRCSEMSLVVPRRASLSVAPLGLMLLLSRLISCSAPNIATYFGTKTRYEEVNARLLRDVLSVNLSVLRAPQRERCSPVHLTAVIRHGSRYPTVKNIRRIQKLSELVRTEASRRSEEILKHWDMWYTEDMDGKDKNNGQIL